MKRFEDYIYQVLKGTYLSRKEKKAWAEEMMCHLEESAEGYLNDGLSEDEASQRAISAFGTAKQIRAQAIRDTFFISPRWFILGGFLSIIALLTSLYTNMRFNDIIIKSGGPNAWINIPNPPAVKWLHHYFPIHPNLWAALGAMCLMLLFTRTHRDRVAVFVSAVPFGILEALLQIHPIRWGEARYLFFAVSPIMTPLGTASILGCLIFLGMSTLLYTWTGNLKVSLTPWMITIALTAWPFLRNTVQSALWKWTQNPIFWGHHLPGGWTSWYLFLSVLLRALFVALFFFIARWIDKTQRNRLNEA